MHGLPRDTGFGRLVQILIAQHKVSRAVGVQNQQRLFKAGKISHQVLEITAVFGVTVHHQLLKTAGLHAPQNLVQTFLDSGIRQHDRLSSTVLGRLRHLGQADIVLFHFLTPLVIDFLYLAFGQFQILSMGYMGRMICLKGMIRVSCGVAPCVRDMTENAAFSFSSGKI